MNTKNRSPKVQRVFTVIGLFSAVGVAIIPNGLFTSTVQVTVKPALSMLGDREGSVGIFQQNINLSGNIHPYLSAQAQDVVPAQGGCPKIGCDEPSRP
jgi:hypothetical protein